MTWRSFTAKLRRAASADNVVNVTGLVRNVNTDAFIAGTFVFIYVEYDSAIASIIIFFKSDYVSHATTARQLSTCCGALTYYCRLNVEWYCRGLNDYQHYIPCS